MNDGFGIGVGLETMSLGLELGAQVAEVLDDAVVDDGDLRRHVRMGIALGRTAVGSPSACGRCRSVRSSGSTSRRAFEIAQFAFGAAAFERAGFDGGDAG